MAKQIYIDGNGNEQLVSGTINTAEMLPIESGSATDTKSYIDSKTIFNELSIDVASGITSVSKAYQISDKLILVNFECTIATASNTYVQCFTIDWATAFSTSNFAVVSDGGTYQSYIQGYYNSGKIIVRINEPKATKYRGQLFIVLV